MSVPVSRLSPWRSRTSVKSWSALELKSLRELADAGESVAVIATRLRRTESAIRNKAGMHGISLGAKVRAEDEEEAFADLSDDA
ncbi:MAG: hypothetical protein ACJ8MH_03805 [Povalibacter sp.]